MAILSASEFRASREAKEAGVDSVEDPDVESAIRRAEALLNLSLGYKVATDATTVTFTTRSTDELLTVPERIRSITSITDAYPDSDPVAVTDYVQRSDFRIYRRARWYEDNTVVVTGTFGFDVDDDKYVLAKQFVLVAAVRDLQTVGTDTGLPPAPPGAVLTGLSSEATSFSFFTPTGETTGYADLDKLLDQIGRHPHKRKDGLHTVSIGGGLETYGPDSWWWDPDFPG